MNTAATQVWMNDNALCDKLGEWWVEELDMDRGGPADWIATANAGLEERGFAMRVLEVRDAEDNLDWLVQE